MPTQGTAPEGPVRLPGPIAKKLALYGMFGAVFMGLVSAWMPDQARSSPVSPLVVDRAIGFTGATPWISPTGEQLITYLRQDEGVFPVPGLTARINGAPFAPFEALTPRPGLSPPSAAIGPDGTARLVWQATGGGNLTEQAIRPPGGPPGAAARAGDCNGPAAVAASRTGRSLSACQADADPSPRRIGLAGLGQLSSGIAPTLEVTPAITRLTGDPLVAWGTDGTGIVAFGYREGSSPEEWKIAARLTRSGSSLLPAEQVGSETGPATLVPTGVAVLPDGTAAITANSSQGGVLFTRPPGTGKAFERIDLDQVTASMPSADKWGRLHFLTSGPGSPGETAWWVRVLELDGTVGRAIPVPTEGSEATPVGNGLQVSPNGAEAIVTRSDLGFFMSQRPPGAGAFKVPKELEDSTGVSAGAVARTPQGDLLLVWEREASSTSRQLMVGGWDANGRPVISKVSVPKRAKRGVPVRMSVIASDPMGISRVVWKLPGNRKVKGESIRVRLRTPGLNQIQVSVFDRAGNRSLRISRVKVVTPRKRGTQGRAGTSGSPRP